MNFSNDSGTVTIFIEGRMDTTRAPSMETDIMFALKNANPEKVIIDAQNLLYISSSGLRVLMKLAKLYKDFEVINVSPNVYDIFDVTGFVDVIKIRKTYRTVHTEELNVIRRDNDGVVYELPDDKVLKIYHKGFDEDYVNNDKSTVNKLLKADIPVMIAAETVRTEAGQFGVIFVK